MSTTIEKTSAPKLTRLPPEEKFWKRYSPHGEAPLSMAGSIGLHALAAGVLLLFGIYLASLFNKTTDTLPVEPVRLDLGGGGGKPHGVGKAKGIGHGPEDIAERNWDLDQPDLEDAPPRPSLDPVEKARIEDKFVPADARYLTQPTSDPFKAFTRLNENIRRKLADGLNPGKGKGGSGSDGGSGSGKGSGDGSATGQGKATLNQREKRMLRWHMLFDANSGPEYLAQLRGVGAILAFPISDGPKPTYKVVRNLQKGEARLLDEDLSKIKRIYWIDDKPRNVEDILTALGIRLSRTPNLFVAFMPVELETQLYQLERQYVENVLRQPFNENKIEEAVFRAVPAGSGKFKPELIRVTMK